MAAVFQEDTAVERVAPGLYRGKIDKMWNLFPLPQGGVVTAVALRAMAAELGDVEESLRSCHTTFVAQVADGPVRVEVDVLRRGRSVSHLRAEVANEGERRGHVTTAVFGRGRRGFAFTDLRPPDVSAPAACRSFRDPLPEGVPSFEPAPFWSERLEGRVAIGRAPWERHEGGRAECATWYRFDDPPVLEDGTMDPFALPVVADSMPAAVAERVGSPGREWFAPSLDLSLHVLDRWRSPWILAHNTARHARDGYASADVALWDLGEGGAGPSHLVAYATQVFLFSFR